MDEDPQLDVRKKQFADVAVSGDDLLGWAKLSWVSCSLRHSVGLEGRDFHD